LAAVEIRSVNPWDRCSGVDEGGFALADCEFVCACCGHMVRFDSESLAQRHYRTSSEARLFFLLPKAQSEAFAEVIARHVKGLFDRFVTDFNCPGCRAPIVIMWRWEESEEHGTRYEPLTVLEVANWDRG